MTVHRYGLISDTHGRLHPDVFRWFEGAEAILHAGDVMGDHVLTELEALGPVLAVAGNCDPTGCGLPLLRVEIFPFGTVVLTHSHLLGAVGRAPRDLAGHFAEKNPRVIVFGHTHRACVERHDSIWVVNPGPACKPRFRERPSLAVMSWDDVSDELAFEFHELNWKSQ